jgi:predicted HAD superfamily Cof-like phosphohydrolase
MKDKINKVKQFDRAIKRGREYDYNHPFFRLNESEIKLRHSLMQEENNEYLEAALNEDVVEIVDALADQLYVLVGTIIQHGMEDIIDDVFDEVHRSNMSKLNSEGKFDYDENGKVTKSDNYTPPNIKQFL